MVEVTKITRLSLRELYNDGYRRVCLNCNSVFKQDNVRTEPYEDGHGGRIIEMCNCSCDLIGYIIKGEDDKLYICRENKIDETSICYD